eukprot:TRINITY_DN4330_c0_g2_i2.p1 TRINITY_DN4330_c0_g2~~TRINITY_DN4330_c0_g2_i2.p1  ORF type:complete len:448 (-),score=169.44 TRINITY_DN4330_c0_g2_i2:186-1529(-)
MCIRDSSWVYSMLRVHSHRLRARVYSHIVTALILANVLVFVVSTEDSLRDNSGGFFYAFEAVSSCFFLLEYTARLATLRESRRWSKRSAVWARVRWAVSVEGLIDLVSFVPFFLEFCVSSALPSLGYLRILRLVRIMKHNALVDAFDCVARVCYYNRQILIVSVTVCLTLMLGTATLLFYLKPPDDENDEFSSVLATMYLTILMLTGQGQPSGQLPWYTKLVCSLTAFFSVAIFAIPASMLTWGFEAEAERLVRKQHERWQLEAARVARGDAGVISSSSSDEEGGEDDEWQEYQQTIIGEDDALQRKALAAHELQRAEKVFALIDADNDGCVLTSELVTALGSSAAQLMRTVDLDASNSVTLHEWLEYLAQVNASHGGAVLLLFLSDCERHIGVQQQQQQPEQQLSSARLDALTQAVEQLASAVTAMQGDVKELLAAQQQSEVRQPL